MGANKTDLGIFRGLLRSFSFCMQKVHKVGGLIKACIFVEILHCTKVFAPYLSIWEVFKKTFLKEGDAVCFLL